MQKLLIAVTTAALSVPTHGQENPKPDGEEGGIFDRVVPIPAIFFTPETSWGGGLGVVHAYRNDEDPPDVRESQVVPVFIYTAHQQSIGLLFARNYFDKGNYLSDARLRYSNYPDKFYGIGNRTKLQDEEPFTEEMGRLHWEFERRLAPYLYAGPVFHTDNFVIKDVDPPQSLASGTIPGSKRGKLNGWGAKIEYNYRDNFFRPRTGGRYELSWLRFDDQFGSTYEFTQTNIRLRNYRPIAGRNHILALEASYEGNNGNPPFRNLAMLGGQFRLRGHFMGRYRDKQLLASQLGYRYYHDDWWGGVVFIGNGAVQEYFSEFEWEDFHYTGGVGLRYLIVKKTQVGFRLDYAQGVDDKAVYFGVGEAF